MKTIKTLIFLVIAGLICACEKPIIEEELGIEEETEIQKDKDEDEDSKSENEDENLEEKESPTDNYDEKDITDGNDDKDTSRGMSKDEAVSVGEFIDEVFKYAVYVKGYIVGCCTKSIGYANLEPPFEYSTAILLADNKNEKDTSKMIAIQLKKGKLRDKFNLADHPDNFGKKVYFYGLKKVYLEIYGMKDDIGDSGFY